MLHAARDLTRGVEPAAARRASGLPACAAAASWRRRSLSFTDTMIHRFGDPVARIMRATPEKTEIR